MKKATLVLISLVVCWGLYQCNAEASQLSNGLRSTWTYFFSPINCLADLGVKLMAAGTEFVVCVLHNANLGNLIP